MKKVNLFPNRYPTSDHYPFNLEIFRRTKSVEFHSAVTFFVGENGTGKSTLLQALALKCGIHIWEDKTRTRFAANPYEGDLYQAVGVDWTDGPVPGSFFGSQIFRHFAQLLDEWAASDPGMLEYFGGESLMTQSHGQSLMSFFKSRYKIKGIYFIDEPETALSPKSQLELLKVLNAMGNSGKVQFVVASHSPILLACPGADIYSFDHVPLRRIDYEETEHYRIYKDFMDERSRYLDGL
ncbi:MAG: AAA family ATPase [Proteobacteria bacterium]|nr:AAA family ATPase [Pseudomonadota bacterium]